MKNFLLLIVIGLSTSAQVVIASTGKTELGKIKNQIKSNQVPDFHLLPDSPSWVYQNEISRRPALKSELLANGPIEQAIRDGERNLQWLNYMNSLRDESHKLKLTRPGQLNGIPITQPSAYSPKIVGDNSANLKKEMPVEMSQVIFGNSDFLQNPPVDDSVYEEWARKVDRNYQLASRWKLIIPYKSYYEQRQYQDVRGYYFLTRTDGLENKLRSFKDLSDEQKSQITVWLIQMCLNDPNKTKESCQSEFNQSLTLEQIYEFYLKSLPVSEANWNHFFTLHNPRPDLVWNSQSPRLAVLPFENPLNETILDFLKYNIEDEWRWGDWHLRLDFKPKADVHVEFQPGVTPHVNQLGGNTIVMDANAPLSEWDVQWTIRHEFGHVLGFNDCYVEFYDSTAQQMVNYQLDVDNLMCSRKGRLQQGHFDLMRSVYYKAD